METQSPASMACGRCGTQIHDEPSPDHPEVGQTVVSWSGHEAGKPASDAGGWPFPASAPRQFKGSALLCCGCGRALRVFMEKQERQVAPTAPAAVAVEVEQRTFGPSSGDAIAAKMRQVREDTERLARTRVQRSAALAVDADAEEIRQQWLSGTTCAVKANDVREVMFFNEAHIVLKHRSHAEYLDRANGSRTCGAYARLYRRDELMEAMRRRDANRLAPIKEWTGRINPRVVREECAALGVEFK